MMVAVLTAALRWGLELPAPEPALGPLLRPAWVDADRAVTRTSSGVEPVWNSLAQLPQSDRTNAAIGLVLEPGASAQALALSERIELAWNAGQSDKALGMFDELAGLTDRREIAIGCGWRVPVPTEQTGFWDDDVRIGNRDSIVDIELDIDRPSGNLFCGIVFQEGSNWRWALNFSTDGGASWRETYNWTAGYELKTLGLTVMDRRCHVAFGRGQAQNQVLYYRFQTTNGRIDTLRTGDPYAYVLTTAATDTVNEVEMTSNADFFDNRVYCPTLTARDSLLYNWDDTSCVTWRRQLSGQYRAERGLSACTNEGFDSTFLWAAYVDVRDTLRVVGRWEGSSEMTEFHRYPVNSSGTVRSSIGAYHDTILVAYDYRGTSGFWVRYLTNYSAGRGTWYYGPIGGGSATTTESPDVAMRAGGGCGVVYRYYTSPRQGRYTWRDYAGPWTRPVTYADHVPFYNRPAIEYLGGGAYGVAYLCWTSPQVRAAYFDRSAGTGLSGAAPTSIRRPDVATIANGTLRLPPGERGVLADVTGRKVAVLSPGENDVRHLSPGVYFIQNEGRRADGQDRTMKVVVAR